jgi:uncharacterized protein (TIGR02246 family)
MISTQLRTEVPVTMEDGRLIGSADFDIALSSVTCLRGSLNHHDLSICAEALQPGARSTVERRWRSMSSTANLGTANYGVELDESGLRLRWESGLSYATVLLGDDPVSEAVRATPELIGALIAYGQVPPAKEGIYRLVPDEGFDKPEAGKVRAELLAAYKAYAAAVAAKDYAGVAALLAPDVVWTHPNGDTELRPQVESSMRAFLASLEPGARMVTHVRTVEVTGALTAVADVEVETVGRARGAKGELADVRYTTWWKDTWKKGAQGWRNQIGLEFDKDPQAEAAAPAAPAPAATAPAPVAATPAPVAAPPGSAASPAPAAPATAPQP